MKQSINHGNTDIHTCIHNQEINNYYILFLSHLRSCVLKLMSVLHEVTWAEIKFQGDAPAKEKLVLNTSLLGLGSIMQYHRSR